MKKINKLLGLTSVRKKVFFLSKFTGLILILFYVATENLPTDNNIDFIVWISFMIVFVLGVDIILGKFISAPLDKINRSAAKMADLDLDAKCEIVTDDEFGTLSKNLNTMSEKLKSTLLELEMANSELEEDVIQKEHLLAERKELIDTLSHEMKTPLGVIRAYSEGLKEETDVNKQKQYIDVISLSVDKMNDLIVTLLDLSALEAGAVYLVDERFDFIELVETVAGRLLIDTPNKKFEFTYELPSEKIFISADKLRIEQAISNLITNATNHIIENGKIHLSVTTHKDKLLFEIYNDSSDIAETDLPKLWEKFYRTKGSSNGTGLGLTIVSQILSIYKCEYGIKKKAKGLSFYFYLNISK